MSCVTKMWANKRYLELSKLKNVNYMLNMLKHCDVSSTEKPMTLYVKHF